MATFVLTEAGFASVAGLLLTDIGGTAYDYIGIGDSSAALNKNQTDLQGPVARKAAVGTRTSNIETNDTAQLVIDFSDGDGLSGTDVIEELGIFTAAAAGTMLMRFLLGGDAKTCDWDAGDTLTVTVTVQVQEGA